MYYLLGVVIPNVVMNYMLFAFFDQIYDVRYSKRIYSLLYISSVAIQVLITLLKIPFLSLVNFCLIAFLLTKFGYNGVSRNKIIYTFMYIIYIVFIDVIVVPLFAEFMGLTIAAMLETDLLYFITGIVSAITGICTYKIVINCMIKRKIRILSRNQEIFIVILGVFELSTVHAILKLRDYSIPESSRIVVFVFLGFIILDAYIILLFESVSQNNELKLQTKLLEQKEMMDGRYYEELEYKNLEYQKIMHDFSKHINVIRQMQFIDENYCQDVLASINSNNSKFRCKDPVLNIIINNTILLCDNKDIELSLRVEDVDISFMRKIDITTIFLNLINNAIEASIELEVPKRRIEIVVTERQQHIITIITNSYEKGSGENWGHKEGHMGLGLINVRSALEKYNSNLDIIEDGKVFTARFIIQKYLSG